MEFVDNALDDAEALYRANAETYPFEVRIDLTVDVRHRLVTVTDNCRGMRQETLERIVQNVGESQKKGITWVNGQFGFGVHAFRAAADSIQFRTKHAEGDHIELQLSRDQHRGIRRPWASSEVVRD
jgi:HSP90 family molecular chaperone